jgi:hypothetical protein
MSVYFEKRALYQRISRNLALFACILRFAYGRQFGD